MLLKDDPKQQHTSHRSTFLSWIAQHWTLQQYPKRRSSPTPQFVADDLQAPSLPHSPSAPGSSMTTKPIDVPTKGRRRRTSELARGSPRISIDDDGRRHHSTERSSVLSEIFSKTRRGQRHQQQQYQQQQAHHAHWDARGSSLPTGGGESASLPLTQPPASLHQHRTRHSIAVSYSRTPTPEPTRSKSRPSSTLSTTAPMHTHEFAALMNEGCLFDYDVASEKHSSTPSLHTDRITVRHELVRLALDGLFKSPLDRGKRLSAEADAGNDMPEKHVLHVGCGDGSWCVEMALQYPHWLIVGLDDCDDELVVPNKRRKMPPNFKFIRCFDTVLSALKGLPDNEFHLVYARFLVFSHTRAQYEDLVRECWRICKPDGGFVELTELDMRIYPPDVGPMTRSLNKQALRVMESRSLDARLTRHLQDLFFPDLVGQMPRIPRQFGQTYQANYTSLPLGVWGGRLGVMFRDDIHDLLESFQDKHNKDDPDDMAHAQLEAQFNTMDDELDSCHAFMNLHHVFAKKLTASPSIDAPCATTMSHPPSTTPPIRT